MRRYRFNEMRDAIPLPSDTQLSIYRKLRSVHNQRELIETTLNDALERGLFSNDNGTTSVDARINDGRFPKGATLSLDKNTGRLVALVFRDQ